jgi:hypothetical protein
MSIVDTGRFWEILVLQILENTGNTSIADTGRLGTKLRNVLVYCFYLSCLWYGPLEFDIYW